MKIRKLFVACVLSLGAASAAATSTIVGRIPMVGDHASLAVDPVLRKAFIADTVTNRLVVVDVEAMTVVAHIPIDPEAHRVRVDAADHRVHVLHWGAPGKLTTIDGRTHAVLATTTLGSHPREIAIDFQRAEIYTSDATSQKITIYDTNSNSIAASVSLGESPMAVAVNTRAGKIYAPLYESNAVAVISQASRQVIKTIPLDFAPLAIYAEEKDHGVYVVGRPIGGNVVDEVVVIDTRLDVVRRKVSGVDLTSSASTTSVSFAPPAFSAVYGRAYFANPSRGTLTALDTEAGFGFTNVAMSGKPSLGHISADDGALYVFDSQAISVLDARTERVVATMDPGGSPFAMNRVGDRLVIMISKGGTNEEMVFATPHEIQHATTIATDFHHQDFDHYFHTANGEETRVLNDGEFGNDWNRTEQYWRVWKTPGPGRVPVCRFFSSGFGARSSHFYTPYAAECDTLKAGSPWTYEEIAYYIALPDANGSCDTSYEELYRLYNNGQGNAPNHAYTSSRATRDGLKAKGWTAEGSGPQEVFACTPPLKGFPVVTAKLGTAATHDQPSDSEQRSGPVTSQPGWVPGPGADPVLRDLPTGPEPEVTPNPTTDGVRRPVPGQPGWVPSPGRPFFLGEPARKDLDRFIPVQRPRP